MSRGFLEVHSPQGLSEGTTRGLVKEDGGKLPEVHNAYDLSGGNR